MVELLKNCNATDIIGVCMLLLSLCWVVYLRKWSKKVTKALDDLFNKELK